MSDPPKLALSFGALAPSLATQIEAQGFGALRSAVEHLQGRADMVTDLLLDGLLTETEAFKARGRVLRKLAAIVEVPRG